MSFAEKQLLKYGWTKGQGLGKKKNGISEPIKVKLKRDNCGVGSTPGADFTSNWWDKVFDSAASNLRVNDNSEDGVSIATEKDTSLSLKKKHYGEFKRELSYGGFLESSSVQCSLGDGGVTVTAKSDGKTEEGEGEEGEGEGVKILQIADDMLFEACGGRTAHKGARHGLTLSGKLARIQQQEAAEANGPQVEIKGSKVTTKTATSRSHEEKKRKEKKRFRDDTDKDRTQKSKTKKLKMKNQ